MQEYRSFDHYFGTLSGVRGFDDPHALRLPNGDPVWRQPDPSTSDGYLLPYRLNSRISAAQAIPSMSHAWSVQHSAWNNGAMDNWLPAHRAADGNNGPYTMGYLTREDIPFHYALADAFTVCDAYHCSVMGPTHPNRYMWISGTVDPDGLAGGPALDNNAPAGTYSWTTYPERLTQAGVSWKFYHTPGGTTGLAPIQRMAQYTNAAADSPLADAAPGEGQPAPGAVTTAAVAPSHGLLPYPLREEAVFTLRAASAGGGASRRRTPASWPGTAPPTSWRSPPAAGVRP